MTSAQPSAGKAQDSSLSHGPVSAQSFVRASALLAMALFLFILPLYLGGADVIVSIIGGFLASALAAGALGILISAAVRGYLATNHLAPLLGSAFALVFAITLPALLVFLFRSAWDHVLFLAFASGGIFLGAHVALLSSHLATKEDVFSRVALSGLALAGSAGPLLSVLWFETGRYTLLVFGFALIMIAAGSNAVLAAVVSRPSAGLRSDA